MLALWALPAPALGRPVGLIVGEALGRYGFPGGHPFGMDRQGAFLAGLVARGLDERVRHIPPAAPAGRDALERFHTAAYVEFVWGAERSGRTYLDQGDTPVFPGVFEASATVVGCALDGLARVMAGEVTRTFQPIGGLHHAGRDQAAGFCVFNDLGVVIETLRRQYGVRRVAYVDIDVHHGDGVFYAFEDDPDLIFADIHEDGRFRYPGTGAAHEIGRGAAAGTKLNVALAPDSGDEHFLAAWDRVEAHLRRFEPQFVVFQCGADGLAGDPLASLRYTPAVHAHAAARLRRLADDFCGGRLMAFGGGGYHRANLAAAWSAVVEALLL
ncbi:MAG: acetoin utilization protein AcuC [Betaproteobacteria bacterium]|jgi:acetoin utilization protein AcuC|nr:acetoin utilization protein AcuC [Rhodocyclaceae bacterium]MCA3134494.1 acetoin utilization protein AcuC [Rhodocyclaceae bacterium]MCA3143940.1 acetoin utilization protein AcuC [Rhodocyclaceae bacterium]MCA3145685.1 acetoin utilization protein AcuC [Rhodocyclaceae bacterium]MCE2898529.1 acetoin utilization protein AcuC [Betaproteobacteria bacterium]